MKLFRKFAGQFAFWPYYLYEVIRSNFRVAYDVVTPKDHFSPAIVALPIEEMNDIQLLMLNNLITMTPGTLALDVSDDRRTLYIHAMYAEDVDHLIHDFKTNFEPKIRNAF